MAHHSHVTVLCLDQHCSGFQSHSRLHVLDPHHIPSRHLQHQRLSHAAPLDCLDFCRLISEKVKAKILFFGPTIMVTKSLVLGRHHYQTPYKTEHSLLSCQPCVVRAVPAPVTPRSRSSVEQSVHLWLQCLYATSLSKIKEQNERRHNIDQTIKLLQPSREAKEVKRLSLPR